MCVLIGCVCVSLAMLVRAFPGLLLLVLLSIDFRLIFASVAFVLPVVVHVRLSARLCVRPPPLAVGSVLALASRLLLQPGPKFMIQ